MKACAQGPKEVNYESPITVLWENNMKKLLFAAAAAFSAMAVAPAANAAVSLTCPGNSVAAFCTFNQTLMTGNFGDSFSSGETIDDKFKIVLTSKYYLSLTGTKTSATGGVITFTNASLLDVFSAPVGPVPFLGPTNPLTYLLSAGTYYLKFDGSVASGAASYSGTIDIKPFVPEPASWAMMIAGIAVVGVAMRRRSQRATVSFS